MAPPAPTVTITGTFADLGGNVVPGGTVTATLTGYGASIPTVSGAILETLTFSATVGSNGVFTLTLYGNDVIQPTNVTFYQLQIPGSNGGLTVKQYRFAGSGTFDLSQLVPLGSTVPGRTPPNSATPAVFSPIAHQFLTGMNSEGQFTAAQPSGSDLSDAALGSTTPVTWSADTGLSRDAAGIVDVGNGTQGDKSGTLQATSVIQAADAARILSTGVEVASNKIYAFSSTAGSGGTADVGLSRTATNTLAIGNGSQGDITGKLQLGKIIEYNSNFTAGVGIPAIYNIVTLTSQNAAISATTLYAVPSTGAGQYRVIWNAKVTTAAGSTSTLGALTITYTDPDGVLQTITAGAQTSAGAIATTSTGNSTTTVLLGLPMLVNAKASTNIQYAFGYASNAANAMNYNLNIRLEAL